ncbi:hypothetical protein P2W50_31105 [Pseudomonas protegens]|uniref:hypothetical protein n=1 Tax=Pseudomonas protegens TaxID=380021 RepID=UPI0023EBC332|nr:hypothetical protein [Pseudomonas protegens]MDF4211101.1 hypothetical protein [Pseudomonas protegens]
MSNIQVLITRAEDAPAPRLPSYFCPGSGNSGALFQVIGAVIPAELDLALALTSWNDCASLLSYDAVSGIGFLQVVDEEPPAAGTLLDLSCRPIR